MAGHTEIQESPTTPTELPTATETSPLLSKKNRTKQQRKWPKSVVYRVLITGFMVSLSFGVTQVPLIYVFGVMTCDEYYKHHSSPPTGTPAYETRCRIHSIEGSTARSVAILGGGTTLFGVANLFVTGWTIKVWGVKTALLISTFWPAVRLLVQNIGVMTGAGLGIIIVQLSQIITVVGGPAGYILALNSFATEVVLPSERTATIGRLTGCAMFGTGLGYLAGGLLSDWLGIIWPFRITLALFCVSTTFAFLALPTIPHDKELGKRASKSLSTFFAPLKMFTPRKWILRNGSVRREYGVLLLGMGAFMAIFATGYIPVLLQLYATDVFDFGTSENSELISLNFIIRATFLTFVFPAIIAAGRIWMDRREGRQRDAERENDKDDAEADFTIPTTPQRLAPSALPAGEANANEPSEPLTRMSMSQSVGDGTQESFAFDLLYTRWSLIIDGLLTFLATFTSKGWQMYVVAVVIPLAAGTGSAAKGTMLQMCTVQERVDALSAISLLESLARLSTTGLFGVIFSAFADIGRPNLTFAVNAAVAAVGFAILLLARFPPEGAVRYTKHGEEETDCEGD